MRNIKEIEKTKKYLEINDKFPEMTIKAVNELWNNEKYNREGLKHIALCLLIKCFED